MLPDCKAEKRFPASVSVGVIPFYKSPDGNTGVLLGRRSEDGMVSPIAGGLEKGEKPLKALCREWLEETTLPFEYVELSSDFPITTVSPRQDKTSVGLTYLAVFGHEVTFPFYPMNGEIASINFFKPEELRDLLVHYKERLFRPDLNFDNLRTVLYMLSNREGMILDLYKNAQNGTRRMLTEDFLTLP